MKKSDLQKVHIFYFLLNLFLFSVSIPIEIWVVNIFIYLGLLLYSFTIVVKYKFPFIEVISVTILIQNVIAISILYLYVDAGNYVNPFYYTKVPIDEYLPFAFLSVQAIYSGYLSIKVPDYLWRRFFINITYLIDVESLIFLLILGFCGTLILSFNISSLNYIGTILNSFFKCAIVGFIFIGGRTNRIFIILALVLAFYQLLSGMFGGSIGIIEYIVMFILCRYSLRNNKIRWAYILPFAVGAILLIAFLQNIKFEYRGVTWSGEQDATAETFLKIAESNAKKSGDSPLEFTFYLSLLTRINQGAIVSETMSVVPNKIDFQYGKTIFTSLIDAFIPRFMVPDKEQAGGREKIKKFATRQLNRTTSMNIGLLGEGYVNFGKFGCIVFFYIFGLFLAIFERFILNISIKNPLILILFPIFFELLNGSESDFMMLFNGLVKSTFFVLIILWFFIFRSYRKFDASINNI